jgi:hypothetical protein
MRPFCPTETFCMEVILVLLPIAGSKGQVILVEIVSHEECHLLECGSM